MNIKRKGEWVFIEVSAKWEGHTVEELFKQFLLASKKQIHLLKMEKKVLVNNETIPWTTTLKKGDWLHILFFEKKENMITPTYMELPILYEDDYLLVVSKPSSIHTHPNSKEDTSSLINGVASHVLMNGEEVSIKHIHRLDKDTTGCILFAKHDLIASKLDAMLQKRQIKRTYIALVHGLIKQKNGTINKPIGKDRHHATRKRISEKGQQAITHYHVLKKFPKNQTTLISCTLETGRTHQIRVHLSSIHHPLVGDILYGGQAMTNRQALHAIKLSFIHPLTEEEITCYAPPLDQPAIFPTYDWYNI